MNITEIIAFGSLLVSLLAFIYAFLTNSKRYELTSQYRREVLDWFSETTLILSTLRKVIYDKDGKEDKYKLLCKLSAQIEVGRFFFPNIDKGDGFGKEKPLAYQGYRNLVLDFLVYSHRLFKKEDAVRYRDHAKILQRYFTSYVFEIIEPKKFIKETKKHTKKTFNQELSFEDFISREPEIIEMYIRD
ncbi:hypothetical protein GCM10011386_48130 [Parapedobacter defluvii]|uniref:Phage abortive infection protein n=1 Tax=Parapedobacter defluvii TaxID=2045106 RepID=A0ABQ1MZX2_9SPHI|nr:hypothetical protein [Parapedobacter defluvii]GGC50277.1 hypothetical protein GCM10011386_48130 [Parapedobacter defluvii]